MICVSAAFGELLCVLEFEVSNIPSVSSFETVNSKASNGHVFFFSKFALAIVLKYL